METRFSTIFTKSIDVFSARSKSTAIIELVRIWFDNWKRSRETKKRVQMRIRVNNVTITIGKFFDAWKFYKQDISRSEQFFQIQSNTFRDIVLKISMSPMKKTLHMWKTVVQKNVQIKNECAKIIPSAFAIWI
jgi:hypothetical protein